MSNQQLLTVREVADEVKVHTETVRNWIRRKELPAIDIGGEYRVLRSDLDEFLRRRKTTKDDQ